MNDLDYRGGSDSLPGCKPLPDTWIWGVDESGLYSCKSSYNWLLEKNRNWDNGLDWNWIWKLKVPAKVQHFVWLCLHNAIPSNELRHRCNMADKPDCSRCSLGVEDTIHCLRDCNNSKEVWTALNFFSVHDFTNHFDIRAWFTCMCKAHFLQSFWCLFGGFGVGEIIRF